jgi:hypothetical protein
MQSPAQVFRVATFRSLLAALAVALLFGLSACGGGGGGDS